MDVDEPLIAPGLASGDRLNEPYSPEWWRARSTEELRQMISGGSAAFEDATAELERRAGERLREQERSERAEAARKRRLRLTILGIFLLAGLVAILVTSMNA
jgi:hypothetical protein